jgi:hypothetical protein
MQAKVAAWLVEQEALEPALAQQYVGDMFVSITSDACVHPKNYDYAKLVAEQTPGGLNEQNIKRLDRAGTFSAVSSALDDTLGTVLPPSPHYIASHDYITIPLAATHRPTPICLLVLLHSVLIAALLDVLVRANAKPPTDAPPS